jgi:hypothetical protein
LHLLGLRLLLLLLLLGQAHCGQQQLLQPSQHCWRHQAPAAAADAAARVVCCQQLVVGRLAAASLNLVGCCWTLQQPVLLVLPQD